MSINKYIDYVMFYCFNNLKNNYFYFYFSLHENTFFSNSFDRNGGRVQPIRYWCVVTEQLEKVLIS